MQMTDKSNTTVDVHGASSARQSLADLTESHASTSSASSSVVSNRRMATTWLLDTAGQRFRDPAALFYKLPRKTREQIILFAKSRVNRLFQRARLPLRPPPPAIHCCRQRARGLSHSCSSNYDAFSTTRVAALSSCTLMHQKCAEELAENRALCSHTQPLAEEKALCSLPQHIH